MRAEVISDNINPEKALICGKCEQRSFVKVENKIPGVYYCCICGKNIVNAADGFDTCADCLDNMGNV